MRGIHRGLSAADDPHRGVARPHFARSDVAVIGRDRLDTWAGDLEWLVGRDPEAVGLDQSLRLDRQSLAVRGSASDPHDTVGFVMRFELPAEVLLDRHPFLDHVEAMLKVVEHLVFRRQVGGFLAESPLDVPGGEHGMWLVQAHVRVGVDPHAADTCPSVDQDDFLIRRQVSARDE